MAGPLARFAPAQRYCIMVHGDRLVPVHLQAFHTPGAGSNGLDQCCLYLEVMFAGFSFTCGVFGNLDAVR